MTRAEKLFNMRAQVQKAFSDIEHGDTFGMGMALAGALENIVRLLEEEIPALVISPEPQPERLRESQQTTIANLSEAAAGKEVREALDTLRNEPTKIKRR